MTRSSTKALGIPYGEEVAGRQVIALLDAQQSDDAMKELARLVEEPIEDAETGMFIGMRSIETHSYGLGAERAGRKVNLLFTLRQRPETIRVRRCFRWCSEVVTTSANGQLAPRFWRDAC